MYDDAKPLVSVIVPVWNPGSGISRCIDSLRNQTLKDIEMIFVDDCGTDDSMEKVRKAAAEDPRIHILTNDENIGAGPSRNRGIDAARGEYLSFIDPDDYIATDFLEKLYTEASKDAFDIVKGTKIRVKDGIEVPEARNLNPEIRKGLAAGKPLYLLFTYEHQAAIYRREMVNRVNARYGSSARAQDTTFQLMVCSQAKSFSMVDSAHYYFCERKDSAMHIENARLLRGCLESVHEKIDFILSNNLWEDGMVEYLKQLFLGSLREYVRYDDIPNLKEDAQDYLSCLKEELLRIPFQDALVQESYSLRVLRDDEVGLPMSPYFSPWEGNNPPIRYAKLANKWIEYYLDNPKVHNSCKKNMLQVCVKAMHAIHGIPNSRYSLEERKEGTRLLKMQLQCLPVKTRLQIIRHSLIKGIIILIPRGRK